MLWASVLGRIEIPLVALVSVTACASCRKIEDRLSVALLTVTAWAGVRLICASRPVEVVTVADNVELTCTVAAAAVMRKIVVLVTLNVLFVSLT